MKASLLTFSQTGNTLKIGTAVCQGLASVGYETEQINFLERHTWKPEHATLIGVGCPVFENHPVCVVPDFLASSKFNFTGKKAFVFITSGGSPAKSLWSLYQALAKTGAEVIGGIQVRGRSSCPTLFGLFPDRPNQQDFELAQHFGHSIATCILHGTPISAKYKISASSGGFFYDKLGRILSFIKRKATPLPVCDKTKCILCKNCVNECPTQSITIEKQGIQFHKTCIVCYHCWHVCPKNAISIQWSPCNGLIERTLYSERMERWFGNILPDEYVGKNLYKDVLSRKIKLMYNRQHPTAETIQIDDSKS